MTKIRRHNKQPFKVSDKNMLKNYIKIWKKISSLMNIEFDSEPYYGDNGKYMKTNIKTSENKVWNNFYRKEMKKKKKKKIQHTSVCH